MARTVADDLGYRRGRLTAWIAVQRREALSQRTETAELFVLIRIKAVMAYSQHDCVGSFITSMTGLRGTNDRSEHH
jgi:hypothetical protein